MRLFLCSIFLASLVAASSASAQSLSSASGGDSGIPSGAIIVFASACPSGYSTFTQAAGRAIVGTGSFSENFRGNRFSATYPIGARGGVARYRMNTSEMPRHRHGMARSFQAGSSFSGRMAFMYERSYRCRPQRGAGLCGGAEAFTTYEGSGTAFDNRPPYIALNMCRKL